MKKINIVSIIISIIFVVILIFLVQYGFILCLTSLYEKLKLPIFSSFVTIGSFLLSMMSFLIIKTKETIFDSEKYEQTFLKHKKFNEKLLKYDPIRRLANTTFWAIIICYLTSFTTITLGSIQNLYVIYFCIFINMFSFVFVLSLVFTFKKLFNVWLSFTE